MAAGPRYVLAMRRMLVCVLVGCGQPDAPVKPAEPVEVQPVLPDAARPSDAPAADPRVTISARQQRFTTKIGPGHVWFDVRNAGAPVTLEVVSLEYVESGIASPIDIDYVRQDDTTLAGATLTVQPGETVLDISFDTTMIPREREAYMFRVNVKVAGIAISAESIVRYARRIPIRP